MVFDVGLGAVGVLLSSLGWGSNFAVVKQYDLKDGMAFRAPLPARPDAPAHAPLSAATFAHAVAAVRAQSSG